MFKSQRDDFRMIHCASQYLFDSVQILRCLKFLIVTYRFRNLLIQIRK